MVLCRSLWDGVQWSMMFTHRRESSDTNVCNLWLFSCTCIHIQCETKKQIIYMKSLCLFCSESCKHVYVLAYLITPMKINKFLRWRFCNLNVLNFYSILQLIRLIRYNLQLNQIATRNVTPARCSFHFASDPADVSELYSKVRNDRNVAH